MQRGFIQIPILIAIILGISAAGSGGYFIAQKVNKPQQAPPIFKETVITPPSEPAPVATVSSAKSTEKDLAIQSLQKQVAILTEKIEQPKKTEQISPAINKIENISQNTPASPAVAVVVSTFPCSKFNALTEDIYGISLELINLYSEDGFAENPTKDNFDYPYNKTNANKTSFYSNVTRLNQKIDLLDTYEGTSQARSNLSQASNRFQEAFDLKLQGYKLMNNDAVVSWGGYNVIPPDNIDQSLLNTSQAGSKFKSALDLLYKGKAALGVIRETNSCN